MLKIMKFAKYRKESTASHQPCKYSSCNDSHSRLSQSITKDSPADEPHIYPMIKNITIDGEAKTGDLEQGVNGSLYSRYGRAVLKKDQNRSI